MKFQSQFSIFNLQFSIFNFLPFLLALIALSFPASARAANPPQVLPLRMGLTSMVPRPRSQAPQIVELGLQSDLPELLQGRLELQWYYGKRLIHSYVSPELVVATGSQRLRLTLPVLRVEDERVAITAYPRFVTDRQVFELKELDHRVVSAYWKRAFVVVDVQPHEVRRHDFERSISDSLALEKFNPNVTANPMSRFDMLTYPATLVPEDLPSIAAGYACFDILVCEEEGFRQLKEVQLAAIGQWVEGGGSIIIAPRGTLAAQHVGFLNRLAGFEAPANADSAEPLYSLDEQGKLAVAPGALETGGKFALFHSGLGRTVVVHQQLGPLDFNSPEWRNVVAFLWKVRQQQVPLVVGRGFWEATKQPPTPEGDATGRFAPARDDLAQSIRNLLLPERIEGLPLPIVVVILTVFILAIAPGDYFLLGKLNCRKYTWALFLALSALFTLATVKIGDSYMGHTDYRTDLTLIDLQTGREAGKEPRVIRTNRFELQFAATQRMVETELKNALFADLTERAVYQDSDQRRTRGFTVPQDEVASSARSAVDDLPLIEGTMPASFKVHQQLRQWSPRVTRQTSFGDAPALVREAKIDWSALKPEFWGVPSGRQALRDALLSDEPGAVALVINGSRVFDLTREQPIGDDPALGLNSLSPLGALLRTMSVRAPHGLFEVVSQVSPMGTEVLEDLAVVDETDPRQWLLIVAVRRENNWFAYRKLFRLGS